jgi:hypothetical protein
MEEIVFGGIQVFTLFYEENCFGFWFLGVFW